MEIPKINLSPQGPVFSRLAMGVMKWGAWGRRLTTQEMLTLMERSVELGATTFDHADIYGDYTTEEAFGRALGMKPGLRERMELVTKCGIELPGANRPQYRFKRYNTSKAYIVASAEASLRHLQTDRLDLLLIHRPSPLMDTDEIAEAFSHLRDAGKVLHFGVSNFSVSQFELVHSRFPLVTNQVQASAIRLEPFIDGVFDQCLRLGIAPMVWSPLGGGKLFSEPASEQSQNIRIAVEYLGPKYGGATAEQLLIAWLLHHPARLLPILGTARAERLEAIVPAFDIKLSSEDWFVIWRASTGLDVA